MSQKTYTLAITPDTEDDGFVGQLVELPGVITQGETHEQVEERIREALAAWLDDDEAAKEAVILTPNRG